MYTKQQEQQRWKLRGLLYIVVETDELACSSAQFRENDIALVVIAEPFEDWTQYIQPIQLPNVTEIDPPSGTLSQLLNIYTVIYPAIPKYRVTSFIFVTL
jgi:hypothetical protein